MSQGPGLSWRLSARTVSSPSAVGRLKEALTFKFYETVKDEREKADGIACKIRVPGMGREEVLFSSDTFAHLQVVMSLCVH